MMAAGAAISVVSSRLAVPASHCQLRRVDNAPSCLGNDAASFVLPVLTSSRRTKQSGIQMAQAGAVQAPDSTTMYAPRQPYCESIYKTIRRPTRTIMIGNIAVGSEHPIRTQTMTTTDTKDVKGTVDQVMRIADNGADICRITVQGKREADACLQIKETLLKHNYEIPLVADIHFAPTIANQVAECFDKIRINPGNYVDARAQFKVQEWTDAEYQAELEHIEKVFSKLVEKCKRLNRAMRIGTNHGSLSDRILNYYGDTPRGMVESAFEYARIARKMDYHNFLFSMKASNPVVMVEAYRLLASEMYLNKWDYPLHLGVTEAGDGEDGRMKSAIGIGALLQDGLGDTIRVSLTEDPELEIEPCTKLANFGMRNAKLQKGVEPFEEKHRHYYEFQRRSGDLPVQKEGDKLDFRHVLHRDGSVIAAITLDQIKDSKKLYKSLQCKDALGMPFKGIDTVDTLFLRKVPPQEDKTARQTLRRLQTAAPADGLGQAGLGILVPIAELLSNPLPDALALLSLREVEQGLLAKIPEGSRPAITLDGSETTAQLEALKNIDAMFLLIDVPETDSASRVHASRRIFEFLQSNDLKFPVIHHLQFPEGTDTDDLVLTSGSEAGALLVDGLGDGVMIEGPQDLDFLVRTSFGMLQGCRMRNTKTDYVSCPSCGRTLFDLQDVTAAIRAKTSHLPGVAIAIMGCIVNGPGEMADADFGYVGGAPGKIDLYVGKEVVKRAIPMEGATDALVQLIKDHGRWIDPPKEEE
ncbi:4-hydroxy-3-methylbut-2-en-1-yl diphosphate synthase [Klebsormidium nitens]|uniref:4-hydroxy-3-methylbut-2-en-1-yl diphosphate synthase (ferredoxin), chloroplastic n=1 Tax=Klebsormidium nitens TaxID=105231 RepID=A0A1Y1I5W7_KLENI|nr:4-hydroxy-3-methylbut-2-en-1-yl diphosphate synthase [Klebsormidium nitens]|eukprot:GAQ85883.1 4-hydroxy-3-methylbut-2-en-1-yl diphosphate synthase [Klebsormidium nitens]